MAEVADTTGEAEVVEEKGREVTVRETVGPGSRKAIATTVRFINTHVYLDAQMCVVIVVTRESTLIRKNQFGSKSDTFESTALPEMAVPEKKSLKRKEM